MCEPISVTALTLAGGNSLYQGWKAQNDAIEAQGEYQAQQAEANALLAKYQSEDAARRGAIEQADIASAGQQLIGTGRTAFAAGNIALGSGTPVSWEEDTAASVARDLSMSRYNTRMEQWGYGVQRQNFTSQAGYSRWEGRQRVRANKYNTAVSLLGTLGNAALRFG